MLEGIDSDNKLSKREEKQMKKMLKEKDKLEKQALVERMQQRDQAQTKKHFSNVVENQDV